MKRVNDKSKDKKAPDDGEDDEFPVTVLEDGMQFKKKMDASLRWWSETTSPCCRRVLETLRYAVTCVF